MNSKFKHSISWLLVLLLTSTAIGQSNNSTNGFGQFVKTNKESDDKHYLFTKNVLDNLVHAMGSTGVTQLPLKIINDKNEVAFINSKGIFVSEKFVELCWTFKENADDAMAYILAHELGHYKKEHFFASEFGSAYASTDWGNKMSAVFDNQKEMGILETEADEYGLYFSYSAGYNTFGIAHDVIENIYQAFDLPDTMAGYPPKEFRQLQAAKAQEKVEEFIPVFEIGNYLNVLAGQASENQKTKLLTSSQKCYYHLIDNKITTIEMYNNLGLNFLSQALTYKEIDYALPMELDFYTRLYVKSTTISNGQGWGDSGDDWGSGEDEDPPPPPPLPEPSDTLNLIDFEIKDQFLEAIEKARSYFEMCLTLDRNYTASYNNLAAVNLLLGEYEEAFAKARKALRLAKKENDIVTERNAVDLLVLTHFFMEENEDCLEYLYLSKEMESPIYNTNYKFISESIVIEDTSLAKSIKGITSATFELYSMSDYDAREKVNDKQLYDIAYELMFETFWLDQRKDIANGTAEIIKHKVDGQNFYIFNNIDRGEPSDRFAFYDVDESTQTKTYRGIMIADTLQKVIDAYGNPIKVITGNRYNYWVYYNQNIIVKIKDDNTVGGWVFYDVE